MSQPISLKAAEQKAFKTWYNDGLWDGFLGSIFLFWAIAPYLSNRLGDFWSSALLLPVWGLAWLAVRLIRRYVVTPRIGVVKFSPMRNKKIMKFTIVMLVVNVIALLLGVFAFVAFARVSGLMIAILFGLILLSFFSLAAWFLDFPRLYVYGLLTGLAPLIGEWLWRLGVASHHGIPVTLGTAAGIMLLVGLIVFVRLLRDNPLPTQDAPLGEA